MKQEAVQHTTTVSRSGQPQSAGNNKTIFLVAFLDMSWRLAAVVLVPIIGGYELDKHWQIAPTLTIVGFVVAMVGLYFVLKQTLAMADDRFAPKEPRR